MWHVFKMDILMLKGKEHMSVGHNAMAGFIYFFTFIAFLVQCLTGFGLYAAMSSWWLPQLLAWVPLCIWRRYCNAPGASLGYVVFYFIHRDPCISCFLS